MILLAFALIAASAAACPLLSGAWVNNQNGAVVNWRAIAKTGELVGDYVDVAAGAFALYGTFQQQQPAACPQPATTLGFAVTWTNAVALGNSTTSWTGVLTNNTITAVWTLIDTAMNVAMGKDVFVPK